MPDLAPGTTQIGRLLAGQFRIDALLGQGGMGSVYRGTQLSVNRAVAIKLITASAPNQAELVQRFRREAEATARLSHPNTVRLFDFGVSAERELYMVMELLDGCDLGAHLQNEGSLPLTEALRVVRQVLSALCEAHTLGIVHRDLKPGNVFLSRVQGGESFVKVMDFGIAGIERARESQKLTMTGAVMGTPAYMSPEQAQGQAVDARSDLYSLGVMLFEMLSGRLPFEADTIVSLLLAHVTQTPPRLAEVLADFPQRGAVQSLLDRLLAKAPDGRPASAAIALEAVDALVAGALTLPPLAAGTPASSLPFSAVGPQTPLGWSLTQTSNVDHPRRKRGRLLLLAAAALAVMALVVARWHPAPTAAIEPLPTPDPTTRLMSVTIASVPNGASVLLDGAELGKTPYELQFRHETVLNLALTGHATQTLTVNNDSDPNLVVELPGVPHNGGLGGAPVHAEPIKKPQQAVFDPALAVLTLDAAVREDEGNPVRAKPVKHSEPIARMDVPVPDDNASPPPPAAAEQARPRSAGGFFRRLFGFGDQRARRDSQLSNAPTFANLAAAQRAYRNGRISADAYGDAVWALKRRREQRVKAEKENLRQHSITPAEYEWRLGRIDAEFRGE